MLTNITRAIQKEANPQKAAVLQRFFKTGKGEYAEGDIFLGITVPQSRKIAVTYKDLSLEENKQLLTSSIHEERLIALFILVHNFKKAHEAKQKEIFDYYLKHTHYINNWDLVDLSAEKIVGEYLLHHPNEKLLISLANSSNLWEKRIAIISTYAFIRHGISEPTITLATILINDKHDLIQKAVGWMLREVGKRVSQEKEEIFLQQYATTMPRIMLRYAIERFPKKLRDYYLHAATK
jgi:3-methyladenine DNA glycosylase AlkD